MAGHGYAALRMGKRQPNGPGVAALLSGLLPGLGQAWLGARRRGLLIALPILLGLAVLGVAVWIDPVSALDTFLRPGVFVGVLLAIIVIAVYHVAAIGDAFRLGSRIRRRASAESPRSRGRPALLLIVALVAVTAFYGTIELVGVRAYQAANAIFVNPSSGLQIPAASFSPRPTGTPGPSQTATPPTATPIPGPAWAQDGRLNLLLIGTDAGPGRWLARTDTMVVLSVDVATGRAALFSVPRNVIGVPLPPESAAAFPDGRFPGLLNALYVYAVGHPKKFPGDSDEARGFRAISGAIQELVGVALDGAIVVNLNGFVDLVDAVGGLWVDLPYALYDAHYPTPDGLHYITISFKAGCQHLDGVRALEYARSRHMDSDYGRILRQQRVIKALARQLDPIALLPQVPHLLQIAQDNLWTTIAETDVAELAVLAAQVDTDNIKGISFAPPKYPEYLRTKDIDRIRAVVGTIFDTSPTSSPTPSATPRPCPRKT